MAGLKNIFKSSRKSQGGATYPELQQSNSGVPQSTSTVFSSESGYSNLSSTNSNVTPPQRSSYPSYEGPNAFHNGAELDGRGQYQNRGLNQSYQSNTFPSQHSQQDAYDSNVNGQRCASVNRRPLPAQSPPMQHQLPLPQMTYDATPYSHGWPNVDRPLSIGRMQQMPPPVQGVSMSPPQASVRHVSMSLPTTRQVSISASPSTPLASEPPPYAVREGMQSLQNGIQNTNIQESQLRSAFIANDYANRGKASADAERGALQREQDASKDTIRQLRELIRERYALDIFIWNRRETHKANYRKILPKCQKADFLLQQIYFIVNSWDKGSFDPEEWEIAEKIKDCLRIGQLENGDSNEPAYWESLPPWERVDEAEDMRVRYSSRR